MKIAFNTSRLTVIELTPEIDQMMSARLLARIPELLTPAVVSNLPPYFHDIDSATAAQQWLDQLLSDSRLFILEHQESGLIIGFLFTSVETNGDVHIGYLLAEDFWGRGLATELLQELVIYGKHQPNWKTLVGGVDLHNVASRHLLLKLGFTQRPENDQPVLFYQFPLYD